MSTYFTVTLNPGGTTFRCAEDQSVLVGMERLGHCGIPVGCRGGGCGVCKVEILDGEVTRRRMSRAHVSEADEAAGCVLACRIYPRSDLVLRVPGGATVGSTTNEAAA